MINWTRIPKVIIQKSSISFQNSSSLCSSYNEYIGKYNMWGNSVMTIKYEFSFEIIPHCIKKQETKEKKK